MRGTAAAAMSVTAGTFGETPAASSELPLVYPKKYAKWPGGSVMMRCAECGKTYESLVEVLGDTDVEDKMIHGTEQYFHCGEQLKTKTRKDMVAAAEPPPTDQWKDYKPVPGARARSADVVGSKGTAPPKAPQPSAKRVAKPKADPQPKVVDRPRHVIRHTEDHPRPPKATASEKTDAHKFATTVLPRKRSILYRRMQCTNHFGAESADGRGITSHQCMV